MKVYVKFLEKGLTILEKVYYKNVYKNELKLYDRSNKSIWTDDHISKSLLECQLDETNNVGSRKPANRITIVNWINSRIKQKY